MTVSCVVQRAFPPDPVQRDIPYRSFFDQPFCDSVSVRKQQDQTRITFKPAMVDGWWLAERVRYVVSWKLENRAHRRVCTAALEIRL